MSNPSQVRVWDPLVRFFHWSLVTAFFIAYFTEGEPLVIHNQAGYLVLILLTVRVVWGFIGSPHARFRDFIYSPASIWQFLKDTMRLRARRYLGHNPAAGAMVMLLMISLSLTTVSGLVLLAADEHLGPLAFLFNPVDYPWAHDVEEVHEVFANLTVLLVVFHVLGVIVESLIHRENLAGAMVTGYKRTDSNTD